MMRSIRWRTTITSPIGDLLLLSDGVALCRLWMQGGPRTVSPDPAWTEDVGPFDEAISQLDQYFAGQRTAFDLPVAMEGTPFQQRVWAALRTIPYGATISYGQLAAAIGQPSASRAVGLANGRNPVSIIVPCHRVIGSDGTLTGYGGGLERKRLLLDLEGAVTGPARRASGAQLRLLDLDAEPGGGPVEPRSLGPLDRYR